MEEPCKKRVREEVDENNDDRKEDKLEAKNELKDKKPKVAMSTTSEGAVDIVTACPFRQMPGHTGYLTFAVIYP